MTNRSSLHSSLVLSVNVDHVATLRQARHAGYPQPVEAARLAEEAGAGGITVHLREDRRHIQEDDVVALRASIRGKLNLEIAATEEMLRIATRIRPDQVTLVPERPDEVTTEGGLDLTVHQRRVQRMATSLAGEQIAVSIFLDPEARQLDVLAGMTEVLGVEINTDAYTRADSEHRDHELSKIRAVAELAHDRQLRVYAGHGLTSMNVGPIAKTEPIEELNIGHWIVSRAVLVGMHEAVREMLDAMAAQRLAPES
jgi:pyridoxine 5-phosphate synthase